MSCHSARISDIDLWHQRLSHVNNKDVKNLVKHELVRGLPKLQKTPNNVCGPCQLVKKIKTSHKKFDSLTTKRSFELLHMDLMGPTKVESIGGKKHIVLIVDDFLRLTWVRHLREKS